MRQICDWRYVNIYSVFYVSRFGWNKFLFQKATFWECTSDRDPQRDKIVC